MVPLAMPFLFFFVAGERIARIELVATVEIPKYAFWPAALLVVSAAVIALRG
jgi:hypothetical protein